MSLRRFLSLVLALAAVAATTIPAAGQDRAAAQAVDTLDFRFARDANREGGFRIANGKAADPSAWHTLAFATFVHNGEARRCTGTLVSEEVFLTSAHCIDAGDTLRIAYLVVGAERVRLDCEPHPDYMRLRYISGGVRGPLDFALCFIPYRNGAPESIASLEFEVIDTSSAPTPGETVLFAGFGCTRLREHADGFVGVDINQTELHVAVDTVDALEAGFVETKALWETEGSLCDGDSGGPLMTGATIADQVGSRRIRAVNSNIRREGARGELVRSGFAPVSHPRFGEWARAWARPANRPERLICGVTLEPDPSVCRR